MLKQAAVEYDTAKANGLGPKLHRMTHAIFATGTRCRADVDAYLGTEGAALHSHVALFKGILRYALIPCVERRIEEVHARVKRLGRNAFGVSLPFVSAAVRVPGLLDLLQVPQGAAFQEFALAKWRTRHLLHKILQLRFDAAEMKQLSNKEKLALVYQSSLASQYEPTATAQINANQWLVETRGHRREDITRSAQEKECVKFLKSLFVQGMFFSTRKDFFEECRAGRWRENGPGARRPGPGLDGTWIRPDSF